jgi:very-short-patch-repair endonuclease
MDDAFRIAERQYGALSRDQLLGAHLTDDQIEWRIRTGRLEVIHPNVYRVVGSVRSARQRAAGALLWLGAHSHLADATSGAILRFDGVRTRDVHVLVPPECRRGRGTSKVIIHRSPLAPSDRRVVDGLRCTSAARTLVDLAASLSEDALEAAFESARRMGLATPTTVRRVVDSLGVRAGKRNIERVLGAAEARPKESRLEVLLARLLRGSALPPSVAQFPLLSFRLDRAWPERRFAVEADGFQYHGRFLLWKRDRQRVAAIEAAGWRIMHVTWDDVTRRRAQTLDRIAYALGTMAA